MDRKNILKRYRDAKELTGFKESRKEEGWMPRLGPDDFSSVIRHGIFEGKKAVMRVSPYENLIRVAENFKRYQLFAGGKPMVLQVPKILQLGRSRGAWFLVQESAPSGERIWSSYPRSDYHQKEEAALLYWNTVINFPKFNFGNQSVSDYFLDRLSKWFAVGRENGAVESGFISQREKNEAAKIIFSNLDCFEMEPFFAHFSNTDIIKVRPDYYYIWGAEIVPKPEAAGIAHWLWGATLHAFLREPKWWLDDLNLWIDISVELAPRSRQSYNLRTKIRVNLLERFLGSLLVDLPLKRSPFDKLSEKEIKKAREVIRFAFLHFLR